MNIVTKVKDWQDVRRQITGHTLGFVPTMGNLHNGHRSLCERSKKENALTAVSIFVNPTQFNQSADFELYPRTLDDDVALLKSMEVDYLFVPTPLDIYPDEYQFQVTENSLSIELEGAHRPLHFNGMLTVVLKLLNLILPTRAYFGEKDYQQLLLVKKMVEAFFLPIDIIACKTIRAADNLALSSRNSRLNATQREKAKYFPEFLQASLSCAEITNALVELGFKVDYIVEKWNRRLGAVWLDDVRLIDNFSL